MGKVNHSYSLRAKFSSRETIQMVVIDHTTNEVFLLEWNFKQGSYKGKTGVKEPNHRVTDEEVTTALSQPGDVEVADNADLDESDDEEDE